MPTTARQTALVAFGVSIGVLALKALAWQATDSSALLADAAESALDLVTSSMLVVVVSVAARPPDDDHPWGHGKLEYLSAALQGVLLVAAALGVGGSAILRLVQGTPALMLEGGIGYSTAATVANLGLSAFLIQRGRVVGSPALSADGWHNLADVGTTVGGWIGLGLAWWSGWWFLDPLVALLVTAHITYVGTGLVYASSQPLMDGAVDEEQDLAIRQAIDGVLATHDADCVGLRARVGHPGVFVECTVHVPGEVTVAEAHLLCNELEHAVAEAVPGTETVVHVEPRGADVS